MYNVDNYKKYTLQFIRTNYEICCGTFYKYLKTIVQISPLPSKSWFNSHFQEIIPNAKQIMRKRETRKSKDIPYSQYTNKELVREYIFRCKKDKHEVYPKYTIYQEVHSRIKDGKINTIMADVIKKYDSAYSRYWEYFTYEDLYDWEKYRALYHRICPLNNVILGSIDRSNTSNKRRLFVDFTLDRLQENIEDGKCEECYAFRYYESNIKSFIKLELLTEDETLRYNDIQAIKKKGKSRGERNVIKFLKKLGWNVSSEVSYEDLYDTNSLRFDVEATKDDKSFLVEFDGRQHFEPIDIFGGIQAFNVTKKHDKMKDEYCKKKGLKLLRIRYDENVATKITQFISSI